MTEPAPASASRPASSSTPPHALVDGRRIDVVDLEIGGSIVGIPVRLGPVLATERRDRTWILSGDAGVCVALVIPPHLEDALSSLRGTPLRIERIDPTLYRVTRIPSSDAEEAVSPS